MIIMIWTSGNILWWKLIATMGRINSTLHITKRSKLIYPYGCDNLSPSMRVLEAYENYVSKNTLVIITIN